MSKEIRVKKRELMALIALILAIVVLVVIVVLMFRGLPEVGEDWNPLEDATNAITRLFEGWERQTPRVTEPPIKELPVQHGIPQRPADVLLEREGMISNLVIRDGWIYYSHIELDEVTLRRLYPDGTDQLVFILSWEFQWPMLRKFEISEAGNLLFFLEYWDMENWDAPDWGMEDWDDEDWENIDWDNFDWGMEYRQLLVKYNMVDETVTYHDLTDAFAFETSWALVTDVVFDKGENLAANVSTGLGNELYIFGSDGTLRGVLEGEWIHIARTRDGRAVALVQETAENYAMEWHLREIDMDTGSWGETITIVDGTAGISWVWGIHTTSPDAPFDLYLDIRAGGDLYLYGFNIESGARTRLFSWDARRDEYIITDTVGGFLEDGSVIVLYLDFDSDMMALTQFHIITP